MTKTIKLSEEKARELYKTATKEFKQLLEENFDKSVLNPNIIDRVEDFDSILEILEIEDYQSPYKNPKTKEQKSINALDKLFLIAKVYNEGWIPNWKNSSEYKWFPYKYFSGGVFVLCSIVWYLCLYSPSGVHLKNKELCEDLIKKFRDILEDYWMNKE